MTSDSVKKLYCPPPLDHAIWQLGEIADKDVAIQLQRHMQVDVYDGTADFLRKLELDEDALTKAIIGTIGDIDSYQLPDAKGYTAFLRHVLGVTDEERQQRREQILGTTVKDFRCCCPLLIGNFIVI